MILKRCCISTCNVVVGDLGGITEPVYLILINSLVMPLLFVHHRQLQSRSSKGTPSQAERDGCGG